MSLQSQLSETAATLEALRQSHAQLELQAGASSRELEAARGLVAEYKSLAAQREQQVAQLRAQVRPGLWHGRPAGWLAGLRSSVLRLEPTRLPRVLPDAPTARRASSALMHEHIPQQRTGGPPQHTPGLCRRWTRRRRACGSSTSSR
jgi:hypothetical protein